MPKKQLKKPTITKLKKTLWKYFSAYIRARDGYRCFTCDRYATGAGMHAGHFVPSSMGGLGLRYDEDNVHAQCLTKESKVLLHSGEYTNINNLVAGDLLRAFNESTLEVEKSTVLSVRSFVPEVLYEIELEDGTTFKATADHKVFANEKWVTIEHIVLHDVLAFDILEIC